MTELTLRDYQVDALDRIAAAEARGVRRQLLVMATGTGKTVVFASLAKRRGGRTLILAHRDELVAQAAAKLAEMWPDLHATPAAARLMTDTGHGHAVRTDILHEGPTLGVVKGKADDVGAHVIVASVQTLARERRLDRLARGSRFDLLVADEAHHCTAASYQLIATRLAAGEPDGPLYVGVTATPDRGDGHGLDRTFDEVVANRDILWGIKAGYLAELRAIRVEVEHLDLGGVKVRQGDYEAGAAGRALEEAGGPKQIVAAWLEHALGRRTLVFTPTVATAQQTAAEFAAAGVTAGIVHGGTPLDERRAVLAAYSAGELTVLCNCAVLTEGYDEPRTDCIVVARPTKSRALYCFDAATEVLTPTGWRLGRTVAEGDTIAAFDPADEAVRWEPVRAFVERELLPDERMMALSSPSIDLRVTDTHRMVWRRRVGRARERAGWEVTQSKYLATRRDVWELPVAGHEKTAGVPLSDADLAFVAWVQTDGTVNRANGAVQISQQYPDQRGHIEATLTACGFKWRVSEDAAPTHYGPRRFPLAVYRVSRGAPRGSDRHLTGWGRLADWLPKADPLAWDRLAEMDERQWSIFLDAWHRGDGSKQLGQPWTRRGYHLAVADERVAGWLQAMCMRRGWRANITRQGAVWMAHCRVGVSRYVGGASSTDRPRLTETPAEPGERVWCVSVPSGALLVRRNGKGAVAGNTQMIGRGTRKHPDKVDALVLDVVGASREHSLVTVPSLFGLDDAQFRARLEDGSGGLSEVVDEHAGELVRVGRLRSEEAELFAAMRDRAKVVWLANAWPDGRGRYERELFSRQTPTAPAVVLSQALAGDGDSWKAGVRERDGRRRTFITDVDLATAQSVAEDFIGKVWPEALRLQAPDAPWRAKRPTAGQLRAAKGWRIPAAKVAACETAGQMSELIDAYVALRTQR